MLGYWTPKGSHWYLSASWSRGLVLLTAVEVSQRSLSRSKTPMLSIFLLYCRGIGESSVPDKMSGYSTTLMAQDCIHLLDQLGWKSNVHVVGMSLSGEQDPPHANGHGCRRTLPILLQKPCLRLVFDCCHAFRWSLKLAFSFQLEWPDVMEAER